MADGKSYLEVIENVQIVIEEWLETAKLLNRPIPISRGKLIYT